MELFLITAAAVAFLILGLSITIFRKGRPMQTDVGDNDDMKRLGLTCASAQARKEEAAFRGEVYDPADGCGIGTCATCNEHEGSDCSTQS